MFTSCEVDNRPAIIGASVNQLVNIPPCWPYCWPIDCDSTIEIPVGYEWDANLSIDAELPCSIADRCLSVPTGIPNFPEFEFRINSKKGTIFGAFRNDDCGCDDIIFETPHFEVFRDRNNPNKALIKMLVWDPITQSYSLIQIEVEFDDDCEIKAATSYFVNFSAFGDPCNIIESIFKGGL